MSLADAFAKAAADERDNQWIRQLGVVAKAAMWPWDLGNVTISIDDGQRSVRTLWFEFTALPNYPFRFKFDDWVIMHAFEPQAYFFDSIRQPLFEHIRYRPSLPVDDHIVLGED